MDLFRVAPLTPDLSVEAGWGDLSAANDGDLLFDSGGTWKLYGGRGDYSFHCLAPQHGKTPYKIARINHEFSHVEVKIHRPFFETGRPVYPLQYPLDEVLITNLLSRGRGIEMHGCGIVDSSGEGILFAGESGAGKSTMARLWKQRRGVEILSDDRIIMRQEQGRIWMYGTPWHGEEKIASPARAPVKSIHFLCHGRRNSARAKTGAEAAAMLFARSFPVFYHAECLRFTLQFIESITQSIPCFELDVVPTPEIVDFLRAI